MILNRILINQKGTAIISFLIICFVFLIITGAVTSAALQQLKLSKFRTSEDESLNIAEAGINYYLWHLNKDPLDYADGTGENCNPCGPYEHEYQHPTTGNIGKFSLMIYPPQNTQDSVRIESTGWTYFNSNVTRTVSATIGQQTVSSYQLITNDNLSIAQGSIYRGAIHSNSGIKFNGTAYNIVQSARQSYYDLDEQETKDGVWTSIENEEEVFLAGKEYPVLPIDFNKISEQLSNLKQLASSNGQFFSETAVNGYYIKLRNNDSFDLYTVDEISNACTYAQTTVQTWDIVNSSFIGNYSFPNNGIIFVEDNLWIDGEIETAELTIAAAKLPAISGQFKNVFINNDLTYTNKNGQDTIGLISQNNVIIGLQSENDLEINAALIAEHGKFYRPYYPSSCDATNYLQDNLTLFGSLVQNSQHVVYDSGSGYENFNFYFDTSLINSPAPSFPSFGQNSIIKWDITSN